MAASDAKDDKEQNGTTDRSHIQTESGAKTGFFDKAYSLTNSDQTRAHYARWAETYDAEIGIEKGYRQPERCASALVSHGLINDALILDIGCGTGLSGLALRQAGYKRIDGCDLSLEMLTKAKATRAY